MKYHLSAKLYLFKSFWAVLMKLHLNYLQGQRTSPQILAQSLPFVQLTHWCSESKSGIRESYIMPIYVTSKGTVLALLEKREDKEPKS